MDDQPGTRAAEAALDEHLEVLAASRAVVVDGVVALTAEILRTVRAGGTVLVAGNGGSAADAGHFVAELVGRLSAIQGDCASAEVHRRMSETYGEREGTRRMTNMVIQSQASWGSVTRHAGCRYPTRLTISHRRCRRRAYHCHLHRSGRRCRRRPQRYRCPVRH